MAADSLYCNFHQFGHCKFGHTCKLFHTPDTCTTFHCTDSNCTLRHPKMCKFYARRGWCKFGEECSFLHFSAAEQFANKIEFENMKAEIKALKTRTVLLEEKLSKLDTIEDELKALKATKDTFATHNENVEDHRKERESESDFDVTSGAINFEDPVMFSCNLCNYTSKSQKGVNIHKGAKHKQLRSSSTSSSRDKSSISCIRKQDGCPNVVKDYFDACTAICQTCVAFISELQASSPFPPNLCPCCHEPSAGDDFSLCAQCIEWIHEDGFADSDWGSWTLDRRNGEIKCIQLENIVTVAL